MDSFLIKNNNISKNDNGDGDGDGDYYSWAYLSLFVFVIFGFIGNLLVCLAIKLYPKLQNATNYYLFSLAATDLLVSIIVIPLAIVKLFYDKWIFGNLVCMLWIFFDVLLCTTSILLLCVISCERYVGINNPLKNREKSKKKSIFIITLVWVVSILLSSPILILGINDSNNIIRDGNCMLYNNHFILYGSIISFVIPSIIMVVMYSLTVNRLHKIVNEFNEKKRRKQEAVEKLKKNENNFYLRKHKSSSMDTATGAASKNNSKFKKSDELLNGGSTSLLHPKPSLKIVTSPPSPPILTPQQQQQQQQTVVDEQPVLASSNGSLIIKRSFSQTTASLKLNTNSNNNNNMLSSRASICVSTNTPITPKIDSQRKHFSNNSLLHVNMKFLKELKPLNHSQTNNAEEHQQPQSPKPQQPTQAPKLFALVNKHRLITRAITIFQSNRETNAVKNEQKAVKVLGIVFVIFLIAWVPFAFVNILSVFINVNGKLLNVLVWLGYISSSINPVVYNAFNDKFRHAFKAILTFNLSSIRNHSFKRQTNIILKQHLMDALKQSSSVNLSKRNYSTSTKASTSRSGSRNQSDALTAACLCSDIEETNNTKGRRRTTGTGYRVFKIFKFFNRKKFSLIDGGAGADGTNVQT